MRREKSKWKIACILFVALLIAPLIAFGATQNLTEQNETQPENIITSEYVAELNETPSEDNTDGTAPIQAIQTPENVTDNDTTDNASGITIQTPENATNTTTANATGVTLQTPENATNSNTTGNATGVTLQTPENATDNTSVIGLNYTINESAGESRNNSVTESVIGTPKLIANKESFSLDEEPTFSFEYKTFNESFIKNASQKTFKNVTENASREMFSSVSEEAAEAATGAPQKALKKWVTENETIETCVYDSSGALTDIAPEIAKIGEGKFAIELPKARAFRAGIYKLSVELVKDEHVYVLESEFPWGLVSVNTRKSIYQPGETAEFVIVVLDKAGHSVRNADIYLTVNNPDSDETTYSCADGMITASSECGIYNLDYHTEVEGNHSVSVTGLIDNVEVSFDTYFRVQQAYEFELVRTAQSKIDPTLRDLFEVRIDVESLTDAESVTLKEFVPAEFEVYSTDAATVMQEGDTKTITWHKDLIGKKTSVSYSYAVPPVWPYLYALGSAEISYGSETFTFSEARPWYVAVDPIAVINVQSYPTVGENWSVRFSTTGTADLTITAVDGTTWSNADEDNDLKILELKCGDKTVDYEWVNDSVFIENYECNETGYEISKVLTAGSHHLKFQFGSDVEYAHNWATDLSAWDYRQLINISNTGENLSYYQVKIELNASNVDSNWNWSNNGNDTRFTYYNSSTETETAIPFWIESWNSTANTSKIWVNATSVANNTDTTIYMYYGNPTAASSSNGTATFVFFDDFESYAEGSAINGTGGWTTKRIGGTGYAKVETKNGKKHICLSSTGGGTAVVHAYSSSGGLCLGSRAYRESSTTESYSPGFGDGNVTANGLMSNGYLTIWYGWGGSKSTIGRMSNGEYTELVTTSDTSDQAYHLFDFVWDGNNLKSYRDGSLILSGTDTTYSSRDHVHLSSWGTSIWDTDWIFIRKYASPEPSASLGGTVISSYTPAKQLRIQDERGASYNQSYPYLQKSRTLNASATLSSTDGVGGVRFIVDQGKAGETIVNDTNTSDTFFSAQFSGLCYGNHTLDITILDASLVPLSGPGQTESIDPFWIVPYIIQFVGDSITISYADDTTCDVLNLTDVTSGCNAVTSDNSLELPCWDNDVVVSLRDYSNGIHIFYSDYAKSIYGTYVFGNNEAESGITAAGTHDKFIANNNGYADRFTSLDENGSNADLFGPTHAYVMLGLNDKRVGDTESKYETQLSNVVNDTHSKGIQYENIILLYPTYSPTYDVSGYLDNIDNVSNNLGTRLIKDLYNETKDNFNGDQSWYDPDNVHFNRAGSRNISRIIAEKSTWLATGEATYSEFSGSETTDFNNLPDITNVSDATLQTNTAKITWYGNVNASGANFDTNVAFGFAFVDVNSSGLNSTFNSSANVTLYNLPWSETPVIFEDGSPCQDRAINFYSGGNLTFNVTHFTNYSAGANANLTLWDDTDPEEGSQTKIINEQIKFYANYTNKTSGQSINGSGVYCNISFNVTPKGPFDMPFNSSSLLYEYNRSFSSSGTFNWNVTGNGSVLGYEELNVTDTVTVSTSNNPPAITPNKPDNGSTTSNNWTILNATVTDADNDNTTVYFYANNNSNGLNASEGLVYIGENVANGTTLTYNLTALPIKPSEANLSLLMHFDNRSGYGENSTHVYDFSEKGNNGTVNGNPIYNISGGKFAGAFKFDGTNDYVDCGSGSSLNVQSAITIEAWINTTQTTDTLFIQKYDSITPYKGFGWRMNPGTSDGKLTFWDGAAWRTETTNAINDGRWHHIVVTGSGTTGTHYIDGNQDSTFTFSAIPDHVSEVLYIGAHEGTGFWFNGVLDEVAIYNKTLSADEILNHYRLGEGKYYWKVNATDGILSNESSIWNFTLEFVGDSYIPPDPINLANTTGNFWVNHTWSAGGGNVTDSFNVSMNGTWTNDSVLTYMNVSVGSGGWANITVWAWNASGTGTLSAGYVSDEVRAPGANANLSIWDDTDPERGSQTKYANNKVCFYANYTNKTSGGSINGSGVYCNISFNVTPSGPFDMTFNSSSLLYEYNRTFSSAGTYEWNVTCNGSVQGYDVLNATDTVTISTTNDPPAITLNKPDNGSTIPNNWTILNATVTDADNDPMTVYFYANNNSNGLNASEGLVYIAENVANGTTLTYNLTALPIKPSEANLSLLMHFDNRSGYGENSTHVYDFSGNGNNGTMQDNAFINSSGKFGGAVQLDGNGDNVSVMDAAEPTAYTLSAWVKPNDVTNVNIIVRTPSGGPTSGWSHQLRITSGSNFEHYLYDGGASGKSVTGTTTAVAGNWYHVTGVAENSGNMSLYVNGQEEGNSDTVGTMWTGGDRWYIGSNSGIGGTAMGYFNGLIDEVAIYNKTLSADEILNHYRLGEGKYYWKVNASDGVLSNESDVWEFTVSTQANANLSIWDDTDPEEGSQTKYANNKVCFYANYTNKTSGGSINGSGVYCNISFNVTPSGPFDMPFNSSSLLYEYNRTFSSAGTYEWNVTCNGSVQGYDVLNATDTVTISTTNDPPAITLNKPDNGSTIPNNWTILNATVTDADNDNTTVYFYANNNSNGLNASEGLVYIRGNVANGTTLTYNLTALPIKPSEANLSLLMHFDNRSEYGENSTHVYDFSGKGNNGTVNGNPIYNISGGKFAGAYEFDGTSDYVDCGNDPGLPENTPFTVSAWVKLDTISQSWRIITDKYHSNAHVTLSLYKSDLATFSFTTGNGSWADLHTGTIVAHQWYHVVAVWNGTTKFIYLDGDLSNSTNPDTTGEPCSGAGDFTIGGRDGTGDACIDGTIDEVAIWNRSLSEDEVLAHYRLGEGKYYWKVNASDGVLSNESEVWEFTIGADQTAPSIQLNYPDDKANLNSSTVNFNWTATDNIDDVLLCNLTIDGVVNQSDIASTSGQPTNRSVSGISTGVHNWSVTCRDDVPNVNTSETRTFGVNDSAPNVTLHSPPNCSSTPNSWAILNATVTDADDDPMTVYFYANNNSNGLNDSDGLVYIGENVANGTTLTYNLTALPIKPSEAILSLLMHFDNRSGYGENSTHVYDYSRNGNNGTVNGNPIYNISGGKFAGAFEFDGTGDYVDCGNDPGLPENTPFTVSAWVKLNSLDQGEWKVVTNKLGTDKYVTLTIFLSPANEFSFTTANGTTMNPLSDLKTAPVSATTQWYHVVSTWNGTTKCIYLDGDLSNSTNPASGYEPGAGTGNFSIGARIDGTYCLDGIIDEVAIYNRSLSAEEILNHYRLGGGKYYWKVNATDGVLSNESDVWNFSVFSETLEIKNQTASQSISSINFSGATGATIVDPYNIVDGSGSPQNVTSKTPVVTICNPSSSTDYKIWLKVEEVSGWSTIINDEKFNVTADDTSPGAVSSWTSLKSWGDYKDTGVTVSVGTHKDLYLAYELKGSGTGTSTVSVLGEAV